MKNNAYSTLLFHALTTKCIKLWRNRVLFFIFFNKDRKNNNLTIAQAYKDVFVVEKILLITINRRCFRFEKIDVVALC